MSVNTVCVCVCSCLFYIIMMLACILHAPPACLSPLLTWPRFHGHGVLYFTNGGQFEADWENGRAIGQGTGVRATDQLQHILCCRSLKHASSLESAELCGS